jgi:hypothetical protein
MAPAEVLPTAVDEGACEFTALDDAEGAFECLVPACGYTVVNSVIVVVLEAEIEPPLPVPPIAPARLGSVEFECFFGMWCPLVCATAFEDVAGGTDVVAVTIAGRLLLASAASEDALID